MTQEFPVHFREENLLQDPLLAVAQRASFLGRIRPVVGDLPLLALLGRGGMGSVYYAFHPRLKMEVAVKVLSAELAEKHPDLVRRFQLEAQLAARVKSPHLASVIDVNQKDGLHYLVMEYIHGTSADEYVRSRNGAIGEAEVLELCAAACEGLAAAHAAGVIHRDVKPGNILLPYQPGTRTPRFDQAKISDLGIARVDDQEQGQTRTSTPLGSPGYMSPEQVMHSSRATAASDVFGLGATLYALLSGGRAPFTRGTYAASLIASVKETCTPLRELRPRVTPATEAMVARCLSKSAGQRYPDARALLREIQACRAALSRSLSEQAELASHIAHEARRPQAPSADAAAPGGTLTVLTVEDNETEQFVMKFMFQKLPWKVDLHSATSAAEGLKLLETLRPDVILTDICMPEMDGYEFVERVREIPELELTPVIMKSSITEDVGKKRSLFIGADAYLQKPVSYEMLEKTIGRMAKRGKQPR
ncbi:MAG: protein kinase [Planctomycetota bacterium]|nr:protein kinase [Planctomycetota bacterium]